MVRFIAVDDDGKITGSVAKPAIESTAKAAFPGLPEALAASKKASTSQASLAATTASVEASNAGQLIAASDMEDDSKWNFSYGAFSKTDTLVSNSRFLVLPVANTNSNTGKPVHAYAQVDVPVTQGKKYALRVKARSAGNLGAADFGFLIGKANGTSQSYWTVTSYKTLVSAQVTTQGWTTLEIVWTATETTTARIGPQARSLESDLYIDDLSVSDVTTIPDRSAELAAAKATAEADHAAALTAWEPLLPAGVGGGGGASIVTVSESKWATMTDRENDILYVVVP